MSVYEQLCTYLPPPPSQPNINSEFTLSCSQFDCCRVRRGGRVRSCSDTDLIHFFYDKSNVQYPLKFQARRTVFSARTEMRYPKYKASTDLFQPFLLLTRMPSLQAENYV